MFLMKAQFMHDIFNINTGNPDADEDLERQDSSIIQVIGFTCTVYEVFCYYCICKSGLSEGQKADEWLTVNICLCNITCKIHDRGFHISQIP